MLELLAGVDLELLGDGHVLRALQRLGVRDVGDDRLILARQVLVEFVDQKRARDLRRFGRSRSSHGHLSECFVYVTANGNYKTIALEVIDFLHSRYRAASCQPTALISAV
jgi:hypothetical protein